MYLRLKIGNVQIVLGRQPAKQPQLVGSSSSPVSKPIAKSATAGRT